MAKKASTTKSRVPKTRNSSTMTESAFWGWIRSTLRRASMRWKPISEAKNKHRRKKPVNVPGRHSFEYQCNACKEWMPEKVGKTKLIEVDHIVEAGSLRCADDLPEFVSRLFCEVDGLQVLCKKCHQNKTHNK